MRDREPNYKIVEVAEPKFTEILVPVPEDEPKVNFDSPLMFLNQLMELAKYQNELNEGDHTGQSKLEKLNKINARLRQFDGKYLFGLIH